jgi:predicted RNA-binding Zn-ribbon protein involved in translation (DUF1610 family)
MIPLDQIIFKEISKVKILTFVNKKCPNCGHHVLQRIKRKNHQKFLSLILFGTTNLKRYTCIKCEWKGLKLDSAMSSVSSN